MIECEKLQLIEIVGKKALFDNVRILPNDVPHEFHCYYLRGGDTESFVTIEPRVLVNLSGSVLMKDPLDFGEKGYIELDEDSSPNFLGEDMTPAEFLEWDEQENGMAF